MIIRQESSVDVFNFVICNDKNAILRVIKNALEQVLSVYAISDQYLELFDPMSVKVKISHETERQTKNAEKVFMVQSHRLIFIDSEDVEHGHYLKVLENGHSSKIVILCDNEDQHRALNTHHDYEEILTEWIIFEY